MSKYQAPIYKTCNVTKVSRTSAYNSPQPAPSHHVYTEPYIPRSTLHRAQHIQYNATAARGKTKVRSLRHDQL